MTVTYQTARWFDDTWGCGYPFVSEILMKLANNDLANEDIVDLYKDKFITAKEAKYILHSNGAPEKRLGTIEQSPIGQEGSDYGLWKLW